MATNETAVVHESVPIVRMEGLSVLASNNGTNNDPTTTQFISFPLLPDTSLSGIDHQNLIFARSTDGNTILLDTSQLALLTEQAIPLYDGTNLFQVASETSVDASVVKSLDIPPSVETTEIVETENLIETLNHPNLNEEEILPPDRCPHKCSICGQEFSQAKQLQRHWKLHAEDKPHRCDECDASFNRRNNLLLHQATHCTSDPSCPICKRKFTRLASLKSHLLLHEIEENLTCSECGDEFSTQFKLDKHMQDHMTELAMDKTFICRTCSKGFKKLSHLREHSRMHYKIKASLHRRTYKKIIDRSSFSHKCYFCGKLFQKPSQLIRHNRIHTGERPFKCEVCNKAFNQKGALLIHSVKHTGERPHLCEFCPASFAQKGNLRNHIRRVHTLLAVEGSEGVHKCELCSCVFRKLGTLNAHMSRAHASSNVTVNVSSESRKVDENARNPLNNVIDELIEMSKQIENAKLSEENLKKIATENNVNADILQQALENSGLAPSEQTAARSKPCVSHVADSATGTMKLHIMRDIAGVRWYQCIYCSKEFKKPSDLVRHIRIHTHEKPYKCDQCFRAFALKSTLNAHIQTHSGRKDFSCEHCKKLFSTSGSLKVHLLLHTGAKPFTCTICNRSFRTSGHRNSHMHSHQNEKSTKKGKKTIKLSNVNDINVSNISLQEPILITDTGYMQQTSKSIYQQMIDSAYPSIRPYRCSVCQKGFKKSSHLKQHLRSHTGEKPFECNECHRAFVSNGVLKSHLKTHTGIKAFNCSLCDASFTTNGSLKRHMCIHREDRPYMCPYCQKTFKTSMNCKKHMKTHRYELALGLASGVSVTVISSGVPSVLNSGNQKDAQNTIQVTGQMAENTDTLSVVENSEVQPILASFTAHSFTTDPDAGTETLAQLQDVLNIQTGIIEQAEIVTQAPPFNHTQNNILTLSGSEFVENHLTLQLENNEDNILPTPTINDPPVPSASNSLVPSEAPAHVVKTVPKECNNNGVKDMKKKRSKKPHKCLQCSRVFKKSSYLKQHLISHTGEKPFRCNTCGNMFSTMRVFNEHMRTHDNTQDFKCENCGAVLSSKRSLFRHMAIHDIRQPFHCSYCSEKFSTKELYKEHLKHFHQSTPSPSEEIFNGECEVISYMNQPESVSEQVIISDITQKSVTEVTCMKKNDKTEYLPKHPHVCNYCPKSFKKPSDLIRHLRIHTGEKPYSCETCGKSFTVKSTLDSHIKTHTGERNFACHVCNSLFATKGSLKVHMRLHTGIKPFKCPHCDLLFRTSGHRKSHMASHFKDKSNRKRKKYPSLEAETISAENQNEELSPPSNIPTEVINIQTEPCPEIQVPVSHEDVQLQLPTLVGQNIQITTLDPSFLSKPIQIDPAFLQQLQNYNINITLTPNISDQVNKLVDINQSQPILNLETSPTSVPVTSGTFTVNPMIIQHLGYTIPQQTETQVTDSIPLITTDLNLTKNGTTEVFQNGEILDSQVLTLDNNIGTEVILDGTNKNSSEILPNENTYVQSSENTQEFTCQLCYRLFKTIGQLNAHQTVHKITKYIYHCEVCSKTFKKKNQFLKHMQIHS